MQWGPNSRVDEFPQTDLLLGAQVGITRNQSPESFTHSHMWSSSRRCILFCSKGGTITANLRHLMYCRNDLEAGCTGILRLY